MAFISLYSCEKDVKKEKVKKKTHITLSGTIKNLRSSKITLIGFDYEKKIKLDRKKKTFSCKLNLDSVPAGNYNLKLKKRVIDIYLDGEHDLKVTVNAKKRNSSPKFKGDKGLVKINKYLVKKRKVFFKLIGSAIKLFELDEPLFITKMNKYKKTLKKLLKKYKLEKSFTEKESRNIDHIYNRNFNNYQEYHGAVTGDDEFEASDKILGNIKNVDFNNEEDYKFSTDYRAFLNEYIEDASVEQLEEMDDEGDINIIMLDLINQKVKNEFIKNTLVYKIAKSSIIYTDDLEGFYDKVTTYCTDKEKNKDIKALFDKLTVISKGKPSPKFPKLINYKGGKTSLDDLVGKGKYLYVDVWATWCGFCKKEIPVLKNFEQKYHKANVEFVSISVNKSSDIETWKKNIKEKEMGGIQLFAGKELKNFKFAKDYMIEGLPRFIMLDPEGNIISHNAPRPTDGYKLDEFFEKIGIKN